MTDYSELKRKAQEIRDEVKAGANTANRVGLALEETVKALEAENQRAEQAEVSLENAVQLLQDETEDLQSIRGEVERLGNEKADKTELEKTNQEVSKKQDKLEFYKEDPSNGSVEIFAQDVVSILNHSQGGVSVVETYNEEGAEGLIPVARMSAEKENGDSASVTVRGNEVHIDGDAVKVNGVDLEDVGVTIVNDLTTGGADKALSAEMGKELKNIIGDNEKSFDYSILSRRNFYLSENGSPVYESLDRYSISEDINVAEGVTITITSTMIVAAPILAAFDKDGNFVSAIKNTATYKKETHTYVVEKGVKYIRLSGSNEFASVYSLSFMSYGLIAEIEKKTKVVNDLTTGGTDKALSAEMGKELKTEVIQTKEGLFSLSHTDAGDVYGNAWVRYSDGFISPSAGGAKLYVIKRSNIPTATKVIANVCTENAQFAAIAFYSSETPSTSNYIKDSSVQGLTSTKLDEYVAQIPESCQSIIVLNMSQLQPEHSIKVDIPPFANREKLDDIENNLEKIANNINFGEQSIKLFNPFNKKGCYHHLNQELGGASTGNKHTWIPAQSLYDIAYAKFLGFDMIEANVHACRDGVLITKHGASGAFGAGLKSDDGIDYRDIKIETIDSQYIREHITYDSELEKYNSPIPTLEEFAAACKQHGLSLKADYKSGALEIVRKHLTDDNIFFTGLTNRGNFRGLLEIVWNRHDMVSFDNKCKALGAPLQIVIQAGLFDSLTDEEVVELTTYAHTNGYTVAVVYVTTNSWLRAKSLGIDTNISTNRTINSFEVGNDVNINSLNSEKIELNGCVYDGEKFVINMPAGSTLVVPSSKEFRFGKCAIDICYKGKITIIIGQDYSGFNLHEYSSNGNETISIANAIQPIGGDYTRWCTIKAVEETTVKSVNIRGSFIPV